MFQYVPKKICLINWWFFIVFGVYRSTLALVIFLMIEGLLISLRSGIHFGVNLNFFSWSWRQCARGDGICTSMPTPLKVADILCGSFLLHNKTNICVNTAKNDGFYLKPLWNISEIRSKTRLKLTVSDLWPREKYLYNLYNFYNSFNLHHL